MTVNLVAVISDPPAGFFEELERVRRDRDMVERRARGESLESIGAAYGVTRERARQIIKKAGGPTAKQARAAAVAAQEAAEQRERERFAAQYLETARALAAKGHSLRTVIARLKALDPDVDETRASAVLREAKIVFSQDWSDDILSEAALFAGVWYLLGLDYRIPPDAALAISRLDQSTIADVTTALRDQGVGDAERARVLGVIAAARAFAADNPKVTLTGARYNELREQQLAAWGLSSAKGAVHWPPTRQTAFHRFGGWSDFLERAGLRRSTIGRSKGLLKYTAEDYHAAAADFVGWADDSDRSTSVEQYALWRAAETGAGRERPSSAALRNVFGSWSQAIRAARESGVGA